MFSYTSVLVVHWCNCSLYQCSITNYEISYIRKITIEFKNKQYDTIRYDEIRQESLTLTEKPMA